MAISQLGETVVTVPLCSFEITNFDHDKVKVDPLIGSNNRINRKPRWLQVGPCAANHDNHQEEVADQEDGLDTKCDIRQGVVSVR